MIRVTYAPDLVEETVLLAERVIPAADARAFRRERDSIYRIADEDLREAGFRSLHLQWFVRFGLDRAVPQAIEERPDAFGRVSGCRAARARDGRDEGADLIDELTAAGVRAAPTLMVRLRPTTLVEPGAVRALLRHELMHVADMLDPAFGYERTLPPSEDGPSADNILRDRYRVLWDVTIDGRLAAAGLAGEPIRDERWREFASAFAVLGERCAAEFDRWFCHARPTHQEIVAFALAASGGAGAHASGRCPLCRFPTATLDARTASLPGPVLATILAHYPAWRQEHGICPQCVDLYEARCAV
jgi:hypothetical protein